MVYPKYNINISTRLLEAIDQVLIYFFCVWRISFLLCTSFIVMLVFIQFII